MKKLIYKSILAGLLIGLAACIYWSIYSSAGDYCAKYLANILGSFLFSIGLISVILLQTNLYTGKIGYVNNKKLLIESLIILVINCVVAYLVGLSYRLVFGVQEAAMQARLNATWYQLLFRGIGTGALIYLAVELKKKYESLLPVVLCVMSFILAGFQHSIANCTYFGMTSFSLYGLLGILIVIIGNSIGSLLIRFLQVKGGNNNTKLNE